MQPFQRRRRAAELLALGHSKLSIARELDVDPSTVDTLLAQHADARQPAIPDDARWLVGLSATAAKVVLRAGCKSVDDVRNAIADGQLYPDITVGLAKTTWREICALAGVAVESVPPRSTRPPTAAEIGKARKLLERAGYTVTLPPSHK